MKDILAGSMELMICSVGKDLICFLHIKASQLTCFTSSTKKPNLTTTNKLIMLLKCSAEVIGSYNFTFCTISLQLQLLPFLCSARTRLLIGTTLWRYSPLPMFCSLAVRPDLMLR